ncbi:hypothetical protein AB6A40_010346 [Gnathostoma spinigerum]|uniref:LysM domain-containing protein n=1 Tax=Gnathostoma spinigerum TaxID=75299 RepID=A0ABD6EWZ2_9BILA
MLEDDRTDGGEVSGVEAIELRSRNSKNNESFSLADGAKTLADKIIVERKLRPGDTVNKISLQYSVPISEIKRANNLLADQDIFGLSVIKIPVSRLRKELDFEHERHLLKNDSPVSVNTASEDDHHGDSADDTDDESEVKCLVKEGKKEKKIVEKIFAKTDASVAHVRETMARTPSAEGNFHFVDATSPEHIPRVCCFYSIWLLVICVILMFVVIPLILTFFEENQAAAESGNSNSVFILRKVVRTLGFSSLQKHLFVQPLCTVYSDRLMGAKRKRYNVSHISYLNIYSIMTALME